MESTQNHNIDDNREITDYALELQGMVEVLLLALTKIDEEGFYDKLPHVCNQLFRIRDDFEVFIGKLVESTEDWG